MFSFVTKYIRKTIATLVVLLLLDSQLGAKIIKLLRQTCIYNNIALCNNLNTSHALKIYIAEYQFNTLTRKNKKQKNERREEQRHISRCILLLYLWTIFYLYLCIFTIFTLFLMYQCISHLCTISTQLSEKHNMEMIFYYQKWINIGCNILCFQISTASFFVTEISYE